MVKHLTNSHLLLLINYISILIILHYEYTFPEDMENICKIT